MYFQFRTVNFIVLLKYSPPRLCVQRRDECDPRRFLGSYPGARHADVGGRDGYLRRGGHAHEKALDTGLCAANQYAVRHGSVHPADKLAELKGAVLMEKTVLEQKETYVDSVHRWGRIWGLTLLVLIVAYPIAVSLIFHAQVNWPAFIKGFIAIGPMYWAVGIVEIFTYVPMLGAGGSYLSFVTGNISNLKLPCALDAMERAGVKSNSEEGEVISTIAIAVSSIVTTLIILVGVVLIIPLTPLLSSPILAPAFSQILPALFGGLAVVFVSKNFRLALAPLLLMLVLFIFVPALNASTVGIMVPVGVIFSLVVARILYKKGLV